MGAPGPARPDPDALLRTAAQEGRGRLKIFLGAAPGVGKTFEMLSEGAARRRDGVDVVVGVVETHGRAETEALTRGQEIVPRRAVAYEGRTLHEMDLDAILARAPRLVLVDELAHTNVPGLRNRKRWEDIEELLAAGIDERIRRDLFGHRLDRERYGKGASLEHVAKLVARIAF